MAFRTRFGNFYADHTIGVIVWAIVVLAIVVGLAVYTSRSSAPKASLSSRMGTETDFATAGANGLKPALADLAKRINEGRDATKAVKQDTESLKTRVKALEDSPAFDFKKYENELRDKILKDLPPSVPLAEYRALKSLVAELAEEAQKKNQNFPLCSAA